MKKYFWVSSFCFLITPIVALAADQGIVPCNGPDCTIDSFFQMLVNIYNFIVLDIATPAAIIALIVGGVFIMLGAGNPSFVSRGKSIVWASIIGLALVFCSYLIINTILKFIGYQGVWQTI